MFLKNDNIFLYVIWNDARLEAYCTGKYKAVKFCKEETKLSNISSQVVFGDNTVYFVHDIPTHVMYNLQVCYKSKTWSNLENIGGGNEALYKRDQSGYQMLGDPAGSRWAQNHFFKNKSSYQFFDTFEFFSRNR